MPCRCRIRHVRQMVEELVDDASRLALLTVECLRHGGRDPLDETTKEGHHKQVCHCWVVCVHARE